MHDVISSADSWMVIPLAGMLVGVIAILCGSTVAFAKVVSAHYRRSQLDEMEATLKMEMIQRDMSADEIERVLAARLGQHGRSTRSDAPVYSPGAMIGAAPRKV
jgi:hypothetical protein